jgi:hypothetical protein
MIKFEKKNYNYEFNNEIKNKLRFDKKVKNNKKKKTKVEI